MSEKSQERLIQIVAAAEKLVRCKGRYHSEQNYRALAALFGVTTPDLPPLESDLMRERAEPVVHLISELEKVLAWIEKLPVPTQGATTNYSRLKSVVDTCREAAPVVDDELKQAINRLLDSDGSRGVYSAVRSYEARQELERMLAAAPEETLKICDRAGS